MNPPPLCGDEIMKELGWYAIHRNNGKLTSRRIRFATPPLTILNELRIMNYESRIQNYERRTRKKTNRNSFVLSSPLAPAKRGQIVE